MQIANLPGCAGRSRRSGPGGGPPSISDDGLFKWLNENEKAHKLMNGDKSDYSNDESVADAALLAIAAYRTWNRDQLERVLRASAIRVQPHEKPEKYERADYLGPTIDKAIELVRSSGRWYSTSHPRTDMGNAARFKRDHGDTARFSFPERTFYVYGGGVWEANGIPPWAWLYAAELAVASPVFGAIGCVLAAIRDIAINSWHLLDFESKKAEKEASSFQRS